MPKTRGILDSSPIRVSPRKHKQPERPSESTKVAEKPSAVALPTPPRTRKRKRTRRTSRVTDSDSEEDHKLSSEPSAQTQNVPSGSSGQDVLVLGHKKRRMFQLDVIAEELSNRAAEDEFWTGTSSAVPPKTSKPVAPRGRTRSRSTTRSPSSSPPARQLGRSNTGLFSPPPSKRHPTNTRSRPVTPSPRTPPPRTPPPRTPPRRARTPVRRRLFPERDSPNNPFLAKDDDSLGSDFNPELPHTPLRHVEKPTITYVFRGVKGVFENPLYDPSQPDGVPRPCPGSPSQLHPSDPDFSPTPYCPPKLLFPEARTRDHARRLRARKDDVPAPSTGSRGEGSSKPAAPTKSSNGKGKGKAQKSEWDTSDEEDAPQHERHRPGFTRPKQKSPVVPLVREESTEQVDSVPEAEGDIASKSKKTLRGTNRRAVSKH
ncbi:hypothetical protein NLI96_g5065 [Meripilus lineatus]|uniref:Uncharacterized protein n=1 Tax=Meripilus lineatus TaxID=2056292 RepID=A0AAD5V906_9APHY|nr:hypothetical protein NLI96_g5065 [Physisporinus lineatus]